MNLEDVRSKDKLERETSLLFVLQRLWTYAVTTKSDEARLRADEIAEAASRGLITTSIIPGGRVYGRLWKLTPKGLVHLYLNFASLMGEEESYLTEYAGGGYNGEQ